MSIDLSKFKYLSRRQLEILKQMVMNEDDDFEGEIVEENKSAWLGCDRIQSKTIDALLRACAISRCQEPGLARYYINETGKELLKQHGWV